MEGIPTTVVTRKGFSQVVANAFAGLGFAPEGPTIYEFPIEMFLPGSDLTPINENIDKIVYGLTQWEPETKEKGIYYPAENIVVQGKDYREAEDKMNNLFLKNQWGDGLPIIPPTPERVDWILTGTDLPPDTLIGEGKVLPRGVILTARDVAMALAMAGGRPEYLPVLIATMDATTEPALQHQGWNTTTQGTFPAVIVNGPIGNQIRLSSGYGVMGPDALHPACGPIGRAFRLILMVMGGALPGLGSMALYGASRFTNAVLAEDEEGIPASWSSLSVEEGFPAGTNVVSVTSVASAVNINKHGTVDPDPAINAQMFLNRCAQIMYGRQTPVRQCPGLILIPDSWAQVLADLGWTKATIKEYLWEESKIPWSVLEETGRAGSGERYGFIEGEGVGVAVTPTPEEILLVVAGGAQGGHAYWLQPAMGSTRLVAREVKLPANWDALLAQAEEDLGPNPGHTG